MERRLVRRRGRVQAAAIAERDRRVPMWVWGLVAAGVVAAVPSWGQTAPGGGVRGQGAVPEVVKPTPTLPQGNDGVVTPAPRSENPQAGGGGARPIPDNGVVVPPSTGTGGTVIPPPATGSMPVLPPPGGGMVVPK